MKQIDETIRNLNKKIDKLNIKLKDDFYKYRDEELEEIRVKEIKEKIEMLKNKIYTLEYAKDIMKGM